MKPVTLASTVSSKIRSDSNAELKEQEFNLLFLHLYQ